MTQGRSSLWRWIPVLALLPALWAWSPVHGNQLSPAPVIAQASALSPAPAKCRHTLVDLGNPTLNAEFPPPPAGDRGFDVLSYDLDIRLDPGASRIEGVVRIGLSSLVGQLDVVHLDLVDDLVVGEVRQGDQAAPFTHDADALLISLPTPMALSDIDTFTISWSGRPPRHGLMQVGLLFRHHNAGTLDDPSDDVPIVANVSEPWSAHSWWPCKDHPSDKAQVSLAATVPDTLSVVSNGTLLAETIPESGWRTFLWRENFPLPTYLVGVAASNYVSWQEDCPNVGPSVPLQYFVFPQDLQKAQHDFEPTCAMMDFMTQMAGPYPFAGEKYAQVEIKWIGAIEHTTATSISQFLLTGDGRYETLIVHELAHQWFGDSLTPGVWADIWLNEGFARYCEALWVEHTRGPQAFHHFMREIGLENHPTFFAGEGLLADPDPILPNLLVYDKGAWLLHSLRQVLGDDDFFTLVGQYAQDPDLIQATVVNADLIQVAQEVAGRDLSGFFHPWLNTDSVPELWFETLLSGTSAEVVFHQLQDVVFEMAVPVVLETSCGPVRRTAYLNQRDQEISWQVACPVQSVLVDPDSTVFMFAGQAPPPVLSCGGPFPNPLATSGGNFDLYLTENGQLEARLFDARGANLARFDLGEKEATGPARESESVAHRWLFKPGDVNPPPASGIYWLEFVLNNASGQHRTVKKLTLIK